MEGKTARGASSPAKPALTKPEPLSHTRAVVSSSSHILGRQPGAGRHERGPGHGRGRSAYRVESRMASPAPLAQSQPASQPSTLAPRRRLPAAHLVLSARPPPPPWQLLAWLRRVAPPRLPRGSLDAIPARLQPAPSPGLWGSGRRPARLPRSLGREGVGPPSAFRGAASPTPPPPPAFEPPAVAELGGPTEGCSGGPIEVGSGKGTEGVRTGRAPRLSTGAATPLCPARRGPAGPPPFPDGADAERAPRSAQPYMPGGGAGALPRSLGPASRRRR